MATVTSKDSLQPEGLKYKPGASTYLRIGLSEVLFAALGIFLLLFLLNFFNIVSLSTFIPALKVLPQFQQTTNRFVNDPKYSNYKKLENQASDADVLFYAGKVADGGIPANPSISSNEVYGIFSGYDNNHIQITGYNGVENYTFIGKLLISKSGPAVPDKGGYNISEIPQNSDYLFNPKLFGTVLHLSVTAPQTIKQIFLSN